MSESAVRVALVYPELLGTYGDGGNAEVLAGRLRWRGLAAEVVRVPAGARLPAGCDLYLLGGGEDEPQVAAARALAGPTLRAAVEGGASCLAVCAGLQLVGESFPGADGGLHDGLGLIALRTRRSLDEQGPPPPRAVGDLAVRPDPAALEGAQLPLLTGYENHGGRTTPLAGAAGRPLGTVVRGVGNGTPDRAEGWVAAVGHGHVLATYLHGPALAQNPALADLLLTWATGAPLPGLDRPDPATPLRAARLRQLGLQGGAAAA